MGKRSGGSGLSLSALAFWAIVIVAIAWITATVLSFFNLSSAIVSWMRTLATALTAIVALFVAHNYVRNRDIGWHLLYWGCAILVVVLIILPGFNLW